MNKELLKVLGLNKYEINAYLTLLRLGVSTAYRVSKESGVPFGRIYDILDRLTMKGLVTRELGRPKKFTATEPEVALKTLLDKKDVEWNNAKKKLEKLIKVLRTAEVPEEPIMIIKSKEAFYGKLREYFENSKKELLQIGGPLATAEYGIEISRVTKKMIERGVKSHLIVSINKENEKNVKRYLRAGVEIRDYPIHGLRMLIMDEKYTILTLVDPSLPYERVTISIENKIFAKAMKQFYILLWEKADIPKL